MPWNRFFFIFFLPAPPNWFGAGTAHKSDIHQTSFERICYSSTPKKAFVGLKDFQWVLNRNMRGVKEAQSKRFFFFFNLAEWFSCLTLLKWGGDRTQVVQQKATCVCFSEEQLSDRDLNWAKLEWDFSKGALRRLGGRKHHRKGPGEGRGSCMQSFH